MEQPADEEKKKKNLLISIWDGIFTAINTGFGENYIMAFAIALRAGNVEIGLLHSVPNLMAALAQLRTPHTVEFFKSRKKVINIFVLLQALMWIPIMITPFAGLWGRDVLFLIVFYTLYLSFGSFVLPAWGSLMSDSVPEAERGRYFGLRGKIAGGVTLVSGFIAGCVLYRHTENVFAGFVIIFAVALVTRLIANYFFFRLYDPPQHEQKEHYFSFRDFVRRFPKSNFTRFVFFVSFFHLGAAVAGPYYGVLMLRDFGFSYLTYTLLTTADAITRLAGLTYWGKHADEFGNVRLFKLSAIFLSVFPVIWVISHNVLWLICSQLVAGYIWGGFMLCTANFIYDAAMPQKRVYCISYYNVVAGVFVFVGTLIGGYCGTHMPPVFGFKLFNVLLISSALRLFAAVVLIPRVHEVRQVKEIKRGDLLVRLSGLHYLSEVSASSFFNFRGKKEGNGS